MSSSSMDASTVQANQSDLQNLVKFIYANERLLKEFGAIKIQLDCECALALKKRKTSSICTTNQQITKIGKDEFIYTVHKSGDLNQTIKQSPITNEDTFWSSLSDSHYKSHQSSVSILPNKTLFYKTLNRRYFAIQSVLRQSLLRLGGTKIIDQFLPCLSRAHGPGAVYSLASAQQHLFMLVYHHQGAPRHWYIIPKDQREALKRILHQQSSSSCLEHGQVLIDPFVLDKHNIRYHKIIQYPNEFVVLSAGVLTQSFTEDACWTESIHFALPSWIEEGHAIDSQSSCQCNLPRTKTIDLSLFKYQSIQKYIHTYLKPVDDDNTLVNKVEKILSTNLRPVVSLHPILTTSSSSLIIPSLNNSILNQNQNNRQWELHSTNELHDGTNENTSLSQDCFSEHSQTHSDPSYPTNTVMETPHHLDYIDNHLPFFEDFIPHTPAITLSTYAQIEKTINITEKHQNNDEEYQSPIPINTISTNTFSKNNSKKRKINQIANCQKTLFASGLRNDVNKSDLHHHFVGCVKVTLKQCQAVPRHKYAFILHKTMKQAVCNLQRPIDHILLGQECQVNYAAHSSYLSTEHRHCDQKTILVRKIPENVTENDLRRLFTNCRISKYCPVRVVHRKTISTTVTDGTKILWGYAFLVYNNVREATNVIEHAHQYQINDQPLIVSLLSQ